MVELRREHGVVRARTRLDLLRRNLALQDPLILGYHLYMLACALAAPDGVAATQARTIFVVLLAASGLAVVLVRAELLPAGRLRAALYPTALVPSLAASYVGMASLFDALRPAKLDGQLWAIDRALFGETASVWLARFNSVAVNEWFSFFYESYYPLAALGVVLPVLLDRGRRLEEVIFGAGLVVMVGQTLNTLVPGAGPHATLTFAEPVAGGYFWSVVAETVRAEGVLDVFPSVHTALPVFFTLWAWRHRRARRLRFVWPALALVTSQIVVATMLLRWHWAIDIVAGFLLGVAALPLAAAASRFEQSRRQAAGRQPVWEPLFRWQRA